MDTLHISNIERRRYSSLINTNNKNINTISNMKFNNKMFGLDINLLNEYFTKKILTYCKFDFDHNKKVKEDLPFRNELIENKINPIIINDSKSTNLENSIIKMIIKSNLKKNNYSWRESKKSIIKKYYQKFFNFNIWTK